MFSTATSATTAPVFTTQPQRTFASLFGSATFNCTASGSPQPRIQWFKDGSPLDGETCPILEVNGVSLSDRGFYHCTATNPQGSIISGAATLDVYGVRQLKVPVLLTDQVSGPLHGLDNLSGALNSSIVNIIKEFIQNLNSQVNAWA
jgi:hypothetical protein